MKNETKPLHKDNQSENIGQSSIQAAVKYLIEECVRLGDIEGASVLQSALCKLKQHDDGAILGAREQEIFLQFLRQFVKLNKEEKLSLIKIIDNFETMSLQTIH